MCGNRALTTSPARTSCTCRLCLWSPVQKLTRSIYENFGHVEKLPSYYVMYHETAIREIHVYRGESFNPFQPRRLGPRSLLYKDY